MRSSMPVSHRSSMTESSQTGNGAEDPTGEQALSSHQALDSPPDSRPEPALDAELDAAFELAFESAPEPNADPALPPEVAPAPVPAPVAEPVPDSILDAALDPGVRIDGYRIGERIAMGGFGNVWQAEHVASGRVVAIKVLHPHLISSEDLVLRFEREALAIARMRHPNIVELFDQGRLEDGRPYLVTEFLNGMELSTHIALRGALSPEDVLPILDQLGRALSAAHAQGIVHRDVKASNVILGNHEGSLRVVLLDFGVAKLLDDAGPRLTMSHMLVGSPSCMAPEQIQNCPLDARTDVYALGALAYHMLTGARLFASASPAEMINMHLYVYPPHPSALGDVPVAFDSVIMKALSKNPEDRFADAAAFVDAFRAALTHSLGGAASAVPRARSLPAVGICIDVQVDPAHLEEPDDALLDDMESVPMHAAQYLESHGFWQAWERGNASLFVQPLPVSPTVEAAIRRRVVDSALLLFDILLCRPTRDARVRVCLHVHAADMRVVGDLTGAWAGALADIEIEGGPLLDVAAWAPRSCGDGVLLSADALRGLQVPTEEIPSSPIAYRVLPDREQDDG